MRYRIDIDGTLCETNGGDYENASPLWRRIERVNDLHRAGHEIILWTARGAETGEPWRDLTESQLSSWRVSYDRLEQKPYADVYVDDRNALPEGFFST